MVELTQVNSMFKAFLPGDNPLTYLLIAIVLGFLARNYILMNKYSMWIMLGLLIIVIYIVVFNLAKLVGF